MNLIAKLRSKCLKDCENCVLSWEDRDYMNGDCDCGCVLYGDLDHTGPACFLPNWAVAWIRKRMDKKRDEDFEKEAEAIAEWWKLTETKNRLFHNALRDYLFTGADGHPVKPLVFTTDQLWLPYDWENNWYMARDLYEENLKDKMDGLDAFRDAIASCLEDRELYYRADNGTYLPLCALGHCSAALQAYHDALAENNIAPS